MAKDQISEGQDRLYHEVKAVVRPYINTLKHYLSRLYGEKRKWLWARQKETGELDEDALPRLIMGDDRVMMTRQRPHKLEFRISLLIDISGSMAEHGRIDRAAEAALLIAEAVQGFPGIEIEVSAYHDEAYIPIKEFHERLDKKKLISIVQTLKKKVGGFNNDIPAVKGMIARNLAKRDAGRRVGIVITDGDPDYQYSRKTLRNIILGVTEMEIYGLGIGAEGRLVLKTYPEGKGIWIENISKLAPELFKILNNLFRKDRNGRFLFSKEHMRREHSVSSARVEALAAEVEPEPIVSFSHRAHGHLREFLKSLTQGDREKLAQRVWSRSDIMSLQSGESQRRWIEDLIRQDAPSEFELEFIRLLFSDQKVRWKGKMPRSLQELQREILALTSEDEDSPDTLATVPKDVDAGLLPSAVEKSL